MEMAMSKVKYTMVQPAMVDEGWLCLSDVTSTTAMIPRLKGLRGAQKASVLDHAHDTTHAGLHASAELGSVYSFRV